MGVGLGLGNYLGLSLGSGGGSKPNGNPSALTLTVLSDTSIKCDWTNGATKGATALPTANQYLYLTAGAAGTPGGYTAGKFLITIYGV